MPHLPNWKEMGPPVTGQDKGTEPVNAYDSHYGSYKDVAERDDKVTKPPPSQPDPFNITGNPY